MNYESLLIVTYGRSGSTLLQGVLNEIDGVLIKGENCNFCYGLYQSYKSLARAKARAEKAKVSSKAPVSPWFGAHSYNLEKYKIEQSEIIKRLLTEGEEGVSCYGFKEVRYDSVPDDEFAVYLKFLRDVFPKLGIIFNIRNLDEVLKSGWWKDKKYKEAKKTLVETEKRFMKFASVESDCFVVQYSDVVNKTTNLRSLYDFIGASYDEKRIDNVLAKPHSYGQSESVLGRLHKALGGK